MPVDLDRLKRALADRYAVEREIGRGGMATVYLARDSQHHRLVAIKVLRPEIAETVGGSRFHQEIEIAAALSHPHLLPVYASGEADGFLYYVMPYVEGESLAERLEREGQLPIEEALGIAIEVADGLSYAHEHGVVHRDVKPGNILLTSNHAVLADFGVARAVSLAGGDRLTQSGMAVGSMLYMSPEQASGDQRVDTRTDIYALGCVLYEMLAGEPPFTGKTPMALMARRLADEPPPLHLMRETIAPDVEHAIARALRRTPADRYMNAADFAAALRDAAFQSRSAEHSGVAPTRHVLREWLTRHRGLAIGVSLVALLGALATGRLLLAPSAEDPAGQAGYDPSHVAVLYFEDASADKDLGYFANGLTTTVIHELATVDGLHVISPNGVSQLRGAPIDSVAGVLSVGTVIDGSVTRSGDRIRVTAQMIETERMTQLESIQRESLGREDWLPVVDSIVGDIALSFRRELGLRIRVRERAAGTSSEGAWRLVQQAEQLRQEAAPFMREGDVGRGSALLQRADSLLDLAASLDPEWAAAVVARGWVDAAMADLLVPGIGMDPEWIQRGLGHAHEALLRNAANPNALELRGFLRYQKWQRTSEPDCVLLDEADQDLRRAVSIDPSRARAWATLADLLQYGRGNFSQARRAARTAYEKDAFLSDADEILQTLATLSADLEDYDEAMRWAKMGRRRFPEQVQWPALELLFLTQVASRKDVGRGWGLVADVQRLASPRTREIYAAIVNVQMAAVLARAGLADSARSVLRRARAEAPPDALEVLGQDEAHALLLLGDRDAAIQALAAFLDSNPDQRAYAARDPWWNDLHGDARFEAMVIRPFYACGGDA